MSGSTCRTGAPSPLESEVTPRVAGHCSWLDDPVEVARGDTERERCWRRQGTPTHAHWAAAVLYNGLARYDKAASAARHATSSPSDPWPLMWALPELVEAAMRTGDAELARDAFERPSETTQPAATDWALGIAARCRALLSDGAAADELYREAIARLSRTQLRPELARAPHLRGVAPP